MTWVLLQSNLSEVLLLGLLAACHCLGKWALLLPSLLPAERAWIEWMSCRAPLRDPVLHQVPDIRIGPPHTSVLGMKEAIGLSSPVFFIKFGFIGKNVGLLSCGYFFFFFSFGLS